MRKKKIVQKRKVRISERWMKNDINPREKDKIMKRKEKKKEMRKIIFLKKRKKRILKI